MNRFLPTFAFFAFLLSALPALAAPPTPKVFTPPAPASAPAFVPLNSIFQPAALSALQGLQGLPGLPGSQGPAGPGVGYSAALSGVTPGVPADQAPALAAALTASKIAKQAVVTLPAGLLTLDSPLLITSSPPAGQLGFDGGVHLLGSGMMPQGDPLGRGTLLQAGAAGMEALIKFGPGFMVGTQVRDLTLKGYGSDGSTDTQYGIHDATTNFTNQLIDNVLIENVNVAIGKDYTTGNPNGENTLISHCLGENVNVWYQNTSSEAYSDTEVASGAGLNESKSATQFSTVYRLLSSGQNFLSIHGSGSFGAPGVGSPLSLYNTWLEDWGADQADFEGGRYEHLGVLVKIKAGTFQNIGQIHVNNYHFTDLVDGASIVYCIPYAPGVPSVNGQYNIVFDDCEFDSSNPGGAATGTLNILTTSNGDPNCRLTFNRCRWNGFKNMLNLGSPPATGQYRGVIYNDCFQFGTSASPLLPVSNLSATAINN